MNNLKTNKIMKETAVEWFAEQMITNGKLTPELFEKAKEMEKQQIESAYKDSTSQFSNDARIDYPKLAEQYHNETFKKMKKEKVLLQSSIDGEPIWGYKEDVICVYVEDKNQSNNYCSNCGKQMWQHKTP